MKIIEVTEEKCTEMADLAEDMLMAGGKLMHCIEELRDRSTDYRRSRMSYRHHEDRDRREWDREERDRERPDYYPESRYN